MGIPDLETDEDGFLSSDKWAPRLVSVVTESCSSQAYDWCIRRPGQIIIGAVNGVGINTVPSGNFALEVYGGIRSSEPSPIGVSDVRLKQDITSANTADCLSTILALEPKDFAYHSSFRFP